MQAFTFAQGGTDRDRADGAVDDQIIWGGVTAPNGFSVMAFDVPPGRAHDQGTDAVYVSVRATTPRRSPACSTAWPRAARCVPTWARPGSRRCTAW